MRITTKTFTVGKIIMDGLPCPGFEGIDIDIEDNRPDGEKPTTEWGGKAIIGAVPKNVLGLMFYSPARLELKSGESLRITITLVDVDHHCNSTTVYFTGKDAPAPIFYLPTKDRIRSATDFEPVRYTK